MIKCTCYLTYFHYLIVQKQLITYCYSHGLLFRFCKHMCMIIFERFCFKSKIAPPPQFSITTTTISPMLKSQCHSCICKPIFKIDNNYTKYGHFDKITFIWIDGWKTKYFAYVGTLHSTWFFIYKYIFKLLTLEGVYTNTWIFV